MERKSRVLRMTHYVSCPDLSRILAVRDLTFHALCYLFFECFSPYASSKSGDADVGRRIAIGVEKQ